LLPPAPSISTNIFHYATSCVIRVVFVDPIFLLILFCALNQGSISFLRRYLGPFLLSLFLFSPLCLCCFGPFAVSAIFAVSADTLPPFFSKIHRLFLFSTFYPNGHTRHAPASGGIFPTT
jgi:hypothetical protein